METLDIDPKACAGAFRPNAKAKVTARTERKQASSYRITQFASVAVRSEVRRRKAEQWHKDRAKRHSYTGSGIALAQCEERKGIEEAKVALADCVQKRKRYRQNGGRDKQALAGSGDTALKRNMIGDTIVRHSAN